MKNKDEMNGKKLLILLLILISGCVSGEVVKDTKVVLEGPYNVTKVIDGYISLSKV